MVAATRKRASRKKPATPRRTAERAPTTSHPLRVIGVGASAGGLDALEKMLAQVPLRSGLAILVVQHLDPSHATDLPALLQRVTKLPVLVASQGALIEPNTVYVIPPNRNLSVSAGHLKVSVPAKARGARLPINLLFRSLAEAYGPRAVGIVLSGMGSDGTDGLRELRARGGLGVAQTPASAKFPSMPQSAIDAGVATLIAEPEQIVARLAGIDADVRDSRSGQVGGTAALPPAGLNEILATLGAHSGSDFAGYKSGTVVRRIERRMAIHGQASVASYAQFLRSHPAEVELLGKELLIGVTAFFRDVHVWEQLARQVLSEALARPRAGRPFRIWVPGCSTGEEAYTLAILVSEAAASLPASQRCPLQIFATDLNAEAIDQARRGIFPESIASEVSAERLARYFSPVEGGYQIAKFVRQSIVFATHDVTVDPPFTNLDLISCRNLMIYFTPELQAKLLRQFHYCLTDNGVLVLGSAETVGPAASLYEPIDASARIFRRTMSDAAPESHARRRAVGVAGLARSAQWAATTAVPTPTSAEATLLERYAPPAVVVNEDGDILQFLGRVGRFLEPASGKANLNIHAMVRPAVRYAVSSALQAIARRKGAGPVRTPQSLVGGKAIVVTAERLDGGTPDRYSVLVAFEAVARPGGKKPSGRAALPRESATGVARLRRADQEIRALRLEMQGMKERLQTSNEELQATNEELQTANEELTTSQEEMQSTSEEVQSVNAELQAELSRLASVNGDLQNLLNSANVAIVFLDSVLNVRRYTREALTLFKLAPSDLGRPLNDIKTELVGWDLAPDVADMQRSCTVVEREMQTQDGRWYACRILPYRSVENVVDGVVLTFTDVTAAKRLEATLRADRTTPKARGRGAPRRQ